MPSRPSAGAAELTAASTGRRRLRRGSPGGAFVDAVHGGPFNIHLCRASLAVSGGGPGQEFWGSQYYLYPWTYAPPCRIGANITIDFGVGRPANDTVVIAGMDEVSLTPRPDWIATTHPELGLTVVDGGTTAGSRSDAFAFIDHGYPSLLVSKGLVAEDGAGTPASRATSVVSDTEEMTRSLRLVFHLLHAITTADKRPVWTSGGRRRAFQIP